MIERLELTEKRYKEIQDMLMQPDIITDIKKSKELSIELSSLEDTVVCYQKYKNVLNDLKEAQEMVKDEELKEYALEEITRLTEEKEQLEHELEILLIPKDKNDLKNVIMEIRGAAGGDEGNIFAGDLFRMYEKYCLKSGFQIEEQRAKEEAENGMIRKSKIGTGDRAEKIRTYNYPQNRVTDHRIGFTTKNLDRVMEGELDEIIEALITEDQKRKLAGE